MRKYVSGFLFFFCLTMFCLIALFWMTRETQYGETRRVQAPETMEQPLFAEREEIENIDETVAHVVLNQEDVSHEVAVEKYCLVAEEGYLLVYDEDMETVNLFTHMPLNEFPLQEQELLMEGIWFGTMAEIFSYLESYTS